MEVGCSKHFELKISFKIVVFASRFIIIIKSMDFKLRFY
jgi:hypothetical protein